jgi:hypothetical protein
MDLITASCPSFLRTPNIFSTVQILKMMVLQMIVMKEGVIDIGGIEPIDDNLPLTNDGGA